ncbi:MAG: ribosome biogenesis GTPase YlqF [Clostridiales bacterium]|nr:ribosome biogenesis GTPase YlqF [Clostridiales bacterium]
MQNNIQWFPGHMTKTRRLIEENLKMIDVVVEILDSRIPYSGRNPYFNDIIKNKPRLIVMNKSDLADPKRTKAWIDRYEKQGVRVIPISCATGTGVNKITAEARALIQDKLDRDREKGRTRTLKIMMVGIPNVGKSSLINRLAGRASAKTGDRPGVTKGKQWIRLKGDTELLDTPGILAPKFEDQEIAKRLAYTGAIKDEIMNTELLAYSLCSYLALNYPELLCARYKLDSVDGLEGYEILERIGKKRGFVISGGEIDTERSANMVLDEFRSAKIGNITLETPEDIENF